METRQISSSSKRRFTLTRSLWLTAVLVLAFDQAAKTVAGWILRPEGWVAGDPYSVTPFIDGLFHWTWNVSSAEGAVSPAWLSFALGGAFWVLVGGYCALRSRPGRWLLRSGVGVCIGMTVTFGLDLLIHGGVRNFMLLGFDHPLYTMYSNAKMEYPFAGGPRPAFSTQAVLFLGGIGMIVVDAVVARVRKAREKPPTPPPPQPGRRPRIQTPKSR